jgi:hypothetical protein
MKNDATRIIEMNGLNLRKVIAVIDNCRRTGKISPDQAVCSKTIIAHDVGEANDVIAGLEDITEMTEIVIRLDRKICGRLEKQGILDDYLLA